jgi:hypothetical protein
MPEFVAVSSTNGINASVLTIFVSVVHSVSGSEVAD